MTINYSCLGDRAIHFVDPTGKPHMLSSHFPNFTMIKHNLIKQTSFDLWNHLLDPPEGPIYYAYEVTAPNGEDRVFIKVLTSPSAVRYSYYYLDEPEVLVVDRSSFPLDYRTASSPSAVFSSFEHLQSYYIEYFL